MGLKNFNEEVINSPTPVLVDFWATYCQPCLAFKPVLQQVSAAGAKVVTVDISEEPELAAHFGIVGIPTVIVFKEGKQGQKLIGIRKKDELLELLGV